MTTLPPPAPTSFPYQAAPVATSNGMAVAALILGVFGAVFGLIPILCFVAFPAGVLALILGLAGRGKRRARRKMATWGAALGLVAMVLSVAGCAITVSAFNDLDHCVKTATATSVSSAEVHDACGS